MFACDLVTRHIDNEPVFCLVVIIIHWSQGSSAFVHGTHDTLTGNLDIEHVHSFQGSTWEHGTREYITRKSLWMHSLETLVGFYVEEGRGLKSSRAKQLT